MTFKSTDRQLELSELGVDALLQLMTCNPEAHKVFVVEYEKLVGQLDQFVNELAVASVLSGDHRLAIMRIGTLKAHQSMLEIFKRGNKNGQ